MENIPVEKTPRKVAPRKIASQKIASWKRVPPPSPQENCTTEKCSPLKKIALPFL